MSQHKYNFSLNEPQHQVEHPFISVSLPKDIFEQLITHQNDIELVRSSRNKNEFTLKVGPNDYPSSTYPEKKVDLVKYMKKSYIHMGSVSNMLKVLPHTNNSRAKSIAERTKISNRPKNQSKRLDDDNKVAPTGKRKRGSRDRSPGAMAAKRIKRSPSSTNSHSGAGRSPKEASHSKSSSLLGSKIPKLSKQSQDDRKISEKLNTLKITSIMASLNGVNMSLRQSSFTDFKKIQTKQDYTQLKNEYEKLYSDYTKIYKAIAKNQLEFTRLFDMHKIAGEKMKQKVEEKIHQLNTVRQNEQEKLLKKYNSLHDELRHIKGLLEDYQ